MSIPISDILESTLKVLKFVEPHMSAGGQIRLRTIFLQFVDLIEDEREREKFGTESTDPPPVPASTKPGG